MTAVLVADNAAGVAAFFDSEAAEVGVFAAAALASLVPPGTVPASAGAGLADSSLVATAALEEAVSSYFRSESFAERLAVTLGSVHWQISKLAFPC